MDVLQSDRTHHYCIIYAGVNNCGARRHEILEGVGGGLIEVVGIVSSNDHGEHVAPVAPDNVLRHQELDPDRCHCLLERGGDLGFETPQYGQYFTRAGASGGDTFSPIQNSARHELQRNQTGSSDAIGSCSYRQFGSSWVLAYTVTASISCGPSLLGDDTSVETGIASIRSDGNGRRHGKTFIGATQPGSSHSASSSGSRMTGIRL